MLQQRPKHSSPIAGGDIMFIRQTLAEEGSESADTDASLNDAARTERDYIRRRLAEELKHEPAEQEVDEWLRQHTEGY